MLVLSLFPGIDLLGRGFEEEGFMVVRGPDLIYGGDIRSFRIPAGRFDGIIGGPPCQDFSKARRTAPTGYGLEMLEEFKRIVTEGNPQWWLMENVPSVPNCIIQGYNHYRIDLNAKDCGLKQNRHRHFQFGDKSGRVPIVTRWQSISIDESHCCLASEGTKKHRRSWEEFCELQGLPRNFELPGMTLEARYRAVGNGVPVPMAKVMAEAIKNAKYPTDFNLCACGCGRPVTGRKISATPACRKRLERKRDDPGLNNHSSVTDKNNSDDPGLNNHSSVTRM